MPDDVIRFGHAKLTGYWKRGKMAKITRNMSTPESRAFWESMEETAARVERWPCWKRGIECPGSCCKCTPLATHVQVLCLNLAQAGYCAHYAKGAVLACTYCPNPAVIRIGYTDHPDVRNAACADCAATAKRNWGHLYDEAPLAERTRFGLLEIDP